MKHLIKIEKSQIIFANPENFAIDKAKLEGKEVVLSLDIRRKNRSINENRYLFGVVLPLIAEHLGYQDNDLESLWATIKLEVGHYQEIGKLNVPLPTKTLNTKEFEELMSRIRTWASAELGVYVPCPNEPLI